MNGRLTHEELRQLVPALREAGANRCLSDWSDDDDCVDESRYLNDDMRLCTSERREKRTMRKEMPR